MSDIEKAKALVLELFGTGSRMETLLHAALSRARAEALEEAQETIGERFRELDALKNKHETWRSGMLDMHSAAAGAVQALITSPAPATIPVERVREVLVAIREGARSPGSIGISYERASGRLDAMEQASDALGVDLDAKGEALTICEHNSGRPHQWSTAKSSRPQCIFCNVLKPVTS